MQNVEVSIFSQRFRFEKYVPLFCWNSFSELKSVSRDFLSMLFENFGKLGLVDLSPEQTTVKTCVKSAADRNI
jgi:hypothetical protein